jgi:hypothetical protein
MSAHPIALCLSLAAQLQLHGASLELGQITPWLPATASFRSIDSITAK